MWKAWYERPESRLNSFCLACFNGDYPLPVDPALDKFIMEKREQRAKALADQQAHPTLVRGSEIVACHFERSEAESRMEQLGEAATWTGKARAERTGVSESNLLLLRSKTEMSRLRST